MPCSDNHFTPNDSENRLRSEYNNLRNQLSDNEEKRTYLEAVLCAIFHELGRRGLLTEVIQEAEIKGKVNIQTLWEQHVAQDMQRVKDSLEQNYSKDELSIIRALFEGEHL